LLRPLDKIRLTETVYQMRPPIRGRSVRVSTCAQPGLAVTFGDDSLDTPAVHHHFE